jgi:uncharacterized membrane protein YdbT with pleckstrin-like domain
VYQGRPHALYFSGSLLMAALLIITALFSYSGPQMKGAAPFFSLFAALLVTRVALKILGAHYSITDTVAVQREGIISRNTSEVEVRDIRNIQVKQGVLERLFGLGSVLISTAGQGGIEIVFWGIKQPQAIAETLRKLRRAAPAVA